MRTAPVSRRERSTQRSRSGPSIPAGTLACSESCRLERDCLQIHKLVEVGSKLTVELVVECRAALVLHVKEQHWVCHSLTLLILECEVDEPKEKNQGQTGYDLRNQGGEPSAELLLALAELDCDCGTARAAFGPRTAAAGGGGRDLRLVVGAVDAVAEVAHF